MPVPLYGVVDDVRRFLGDVIVSDDGGDFSFTIDWQPASVELDPYNTILKHPPVTDRFRTFFNRKGAKTQRTFFFLRTDYQTLRLCAFAVEFLFPHLARGDHTRDTLQVGSGRQQFPVFSEQFPDALFQGETDFDDEVSAANQTLLCLGDELSVDAQSVIGSEQGRRVVRSSGPSFCRLG